MTTRTVKMYGLAYGPTPAEITVTLNGELVYNGTVNTQDQPLPLLPNSNLSNTTVEFCNFEIPMELDGNFPMTCTVSNGTVIFGQIMANYCVIPDTDPVVGSGPNRFSNIDGDGDARSSVFVDGIAQQVNHEELGGTWWFTVPAGSTLTYDLDVQAGTANVAPPPTEPV